MAMVPYNNDRNVSITQGGDRSIAGQAKLVLRESSDTTHRELAQGIQNIRVTYLSIDDEGSRHAYAEASKNSHIELATRLKAVDSLVEKAVLNTVSEYFRDD